MAIDLKQLVEADLIDHEGFSGSVYNDHLGFATIGIGRLVDERRGGGISLDEARYLLRNDIMWRLHSLREKLPWFDNAPENTKRALLNMCFQLGIKGLLKFKRTLKLIENGDYRAAADEALRSNWARQTPGRAEEVAGWIRNSKPNA